MIYVAFSKMCPTENARTHSQIIHFFRTTWGPGKKTIKEKETQKKGGHVRSLHIKTLMEQKGVNEPNCLMPSAIIRTKRFFLSCWPTISSNLQRFSLENCKNLNGLLLKTELAMLRHYYPNPFWKWKMDSQSQHQIIFDPGRGFTKLLIMNR